MFQPTRSLLLAAAFAFGGTAMAADYVIDASHSSIGFKIDHMMISTVTGQFTAFEGTATTDDKGKLTSLQGTIDITSINTRDAKRDGHLQSADFFDASSHPQMTFASKKVSGDNSKGYTVNGDLTMHGITKSVTLTVSPLKGPVTDPWGNIKIGTTATGTLDRKDFGLSWSKLLEAGGAMVGDDVALDLQLELNQKK